MNPLERRSTFALSSIFASGLFMIIPVFAVVGQSYQWCGAAGPSRWFMNWRWRPRIRGTRLCHHSPAWSPTTIDDRRSSAAFEGVRSSQMRWLSTSTLPVPTRSTAKALLAWDDLQHRSWGWRINADDYRPPLMRWPRCCCLTLQIL